MISPQKPLFALERLQFRKIIFPVAPLLSSFSSTHKPHHYMSYRVVSPYIFLPLKNAVYVFWMYFESNFLEQIMHFSMFESLSFCTFTFLRGPRSRPWSIIWGIDRQSISSSHAISAGVEWVPGYSSWLRIISFTFHSYSVWLLKILVAPYLYFIQRYLIITFSSMRTPYR